MISRRRHLEQLATLEHRLDIRRQADIRTAQHAAIAAAGLWLNGRAAGYRADADATPSKPKTGPLTDDMRRVIAHELEVCARDVTGLDIP